MRRWSAGATGLSSKEFTPAMVKAVFDNLAQPSPKNHFTVGINDDVTHTSLDFDPGILHRAGRRDSRAVLRPRRGRHGRREQELDQDHRREHRATTRRATSSTTRRKSGAMTVSHLRFGPRPIRSTYLISAGELRRLPSAAVPRALRRARRRSRRAARSCSTTPFGPDEVWDASAGRRAAATHRQEG